MGSSHLKHSVPTPVSQNIPVEPSQSVSHTKVINRSETRTRAPQSPSGAQSQTRRQRNEETEGATAWYRATAHQDLQARQHVKTTLEQAIEDYLQDHEGGNHSHKTIEWHRTALTLLHTYLHTHRGMTLVEEIDAPDISAWFTYLRKTPGGHGKIRSERTIQTYARSVRAFFHWLVRQGTIQDNPFARVVLPKVGKPIIQTITDEEFERQAKPWALLNTGAVLMVLLCKVLSMFSSVHRKGLGSMSRPRSMEMR